MDDDDGDEADSDSDWLSSQHLRQSPLDPFPCILHIGVAATPQEAKDQNITAVKVEIQMYNQVFSERKCCSC